MQITIRMEATRLEVWVGRLGSRQPYSDALVQQREHTPLVVFAVQQDSVYII